MGREENRDRLNRGHDGPTNRRLHSEEALDKVRAYHKRQRKRAQRRKDAQNRERRQRNGEEDLK